MTSISASGVTVKRGGRVILDGVDIDLRGGQFVCVIGPNGAGKSTLLSVLSGLLRPEAGAVAIDGRPIDAIAPRELARLRAYLSQNPRAEWPVSVERLIALGLIPRLTLFGDLSAEMQQQLEAVIETFDLAAYRHQSATTLSGGELARAMLARALVGDPAIVVVDEPLAGLDPRHALDGVTRLRALADSGKVVIAAMHELTLAARYATHAAVMNEGKVIAFGPVAKVLTADLLRRTFAVDACVSDIGTPTAQVDFVPLA